VNSLAEWFVQLVNVDPDETWSLKIIALGTTEPSDRPTVAMQPIELPIYPDDYYLNGAAATLFEGQRVMPACKSLNTLVNYLARHRARQAGALEGLLHSSGYLTEGARSNLFAVQQEVLLTPPTGHVLSGITREIIMQVMQEAGHPVIEAPVSVDRSLYEEFFISSTSMHVMPITKIDDEPVGSGQVGPITKLAMAKFREYYQNYMKSAPIPVH
jgi:branched-subunit amino acid aminotransferase/4-amino-4-deoxychorismate lyase